MKILSFTTEQDAIDALAVIDAALGLPKVNFNAKTGLPDPTAQQTTTWADVKKHAILNKWFIKEPSNLTVIIGYLQEAADTTWYSPTNQ